jgi:hypothetical protein
MQSRDYDPICECKFRLSQICPENIIRLSCIPRQRTECQPVDSPLANNWQIKVIHFDEKHAFHRSDPFGVPIRGPHVRITHTRYCLFLGSAPHTSTGDHLLVRQGFSSNQIRAWRACTRGRRVSLVSPQQHLRFRIFLVALLVAFGLSISDEMWRDRTEQNSQI